MTLKFYNTLGRELMEFKTIVPNTVKMYSCGPTVYNYIHIGNLRAFMFTDILKKYLRFSAYKVDHVMNITDVDDKTIKGSIAQNKSLIEFTEFYTQEFLKDLKTVGIDVAETMPRATDHIQEMVVIIKKMKDNGHTYEKDGSIYAKISTIKNYGQLAMLDFENLKQNADGRLNNADEYAKEDARDFALWKNYEPEDGNVFWETEIGKGRPGWHIECSAMSSKFLGDTFDIHTGGVDLIFPHHTNEIAQSESATGKKFVNFWLHNEHLLVNGEKMSKSKGNFFTLRDLLSKGYDPRSIRYELLKTHYRMKLDFREDELRQIPETLAKFDEIVSKLMTISSTSNENSVDSKKLSDGFISAFKEAMDSDLNISGGLAEVFNFMKEVNSQIDENKLSKSDANIYIDSLKKVDSVLGIMKFESQDIPDEIKSLAEERVAAKKARDFKRSDELRNLINSKGYEILDDKQGYRLKKK